MNIKRILSAASASLLVALAVPAAAFAATTTVTPTNLNGWATASQSTASGSFVEGPATPPLPTGSYRMQTGAGNSSGLSSNGTAGGKQYLFNAGSVGTKVADLTKLSYSTFVASREANTNVAPAININAFTSGTSGFTTLVYEPVYNSPGSVVPTGVWSTWDTLGGTWWSTKDLVDPTDANAFIACNPNGGNANTPACAGKLFVPLSTILAAYPNTTITGDTTNNGTPVGGVQIVAGQNSNGSPWSNFDGNVDNVTISAVTYNFEATEPTPPKVVPTSKDQCKDGGYADLFTTTGSDAKTFKNQGDCVSFVASKGKANGNPKDTSVIAVLGRFLDKF